MTESTLTIVDLRDHTRYLPEVAQWHQRQWQAQSPPINLNERMRRLQSHLGPEPLPTTWLARNQDRMIGCVSLVDYRVQGRTEATAWLANLYVEPDWRGQSIGRHLIEHTCRYAQALNYPALYLFTPDKQELYKHLGWQWARAARVQGQRVDVMVKLLNDELDV